MIGGFPIVVSGVNKGRLDRSTTAVCIGWSVREVSKAYNNWIQIFRMEGSDLTFEQYVRKMRDIGIRPDDVGNGRVQYHLARHGDMGPYSVATCRFILKSENLAEQKVESPFTRAVRKHGRARAIEMARENGRKAHSPTPGA